MKTNKLTEINMKNILILMLTAFASGALLVGCGTNQSVEDNETQQEAGANTSNERVPIDGVKPASPYGHEADTTDNLTSANIGGTALVPSNNIVQNAEAHPELSTFIGTIRQAGLVGTLNGTGPYTMFAPSNEAFAALPGGTLDDLMKPENKQQLVDLVNNHIVAGKMNAKALQSGSSIKTAGNGQVKVASQGNDVTINGAQLQTVDIVSSNGVIHVINKVLMPENR